MTCIATRNELPSCFTTLMKYSWNNDWTLWWAVDGNGVCRAFYKIKQLNHVSGVLPVACLYRVISWPIYGVIHYQSALLQHPSGVCLPRLVIDTLHIKGWMVNLFEYVRLETGSRTLPCFTSMTRVYKAEVPCYCSISVWWDYSMHKLHCQAFQNLNNDPGIVCENLRVAAIP